MKKYKKYILIIILFVIIICIIKISAQPGTRENPLISKSYLEYFFQWRKITLSQGEKIKIQQWANFILYSGEYETEEKSTKIIDLSDGKEITNLEEIKRNHLYLLIHNTPIVLKANKDSVIFIKGKFEID